MFHRKLLGPIKTEKLIEKGKGKRVKGKRKMSQCLSSTFSHYPFPFTLSFCYQSFYETFAYR
jgi:hypothetical protein